MYWSRGCLSRDDAWAMSPFERERFSEFLEKRFKDGGEMMKHKIPVFL